jgi:ribonuclease-3
MKLDELSKRLGYEFRDQELISQALTHKSYAKGKNNERLEFLGDAVLDLVVGEYLYDKFPAKPEGELSKLRAAIVSEKGFQKLAQQIDLGRHILISAGEEHNQGRSKPSLLSNAFEALMGAIYLESDLASVKRIMAQLLSRAYESIDAATLLSDYKTALQEYTQAHFGTTPSYTLLRSFGPDHNKEFEMSATLKGRELSRGRGKTKKEAEQQAAHTAMELLKKENR